MAMGGLWGCVAGWVDGRLHSGVAPRAMYRYPKFLGVMFFDRHQSTVRSIRVQSTGGVEFSGRQVYQLAVAKLNASVKYFWNCGPLTSQPAQAAPKRKSLRGASNLRMR